MNVINKLIKALDVCNPSALPCFAGAKQLMIGSDYSGQHSTSQYEALAFVVSDAGSLRPWLNARSRLRAKHLPNCRRMAFKRLNDRLRAEALPAFLSAADLLHGLLLVVLFDKRIDSIFVPDEDPKAINPKLRPLAKWPAQTEEKLLRICHVMALVLAGLTRQDQHILWVTDQDDIVANVERHALFTEAFGNIASHYLAHTLGHLRIATTASDTGNRDLEDFVAIADIAAGAVCHVLNAYRDSTPQVSRLVVPFPTGMPPKVHSVLNWFSNESPPLLKRLVIAIEPSENSAKLIVKHYAFPGLNAGFGLTLWPSWVSQRSRLV
ncbi:MAG: hypothetical protein LBH31_07425 [Burkholderiaceae bacterium]|nr:hypothetical protein [Burkholderiaceae bacterium]